MLALSISLVYTWESAGVIIHFHLLFLSVSHTGAPLLRSWVLRIPGCYVVFGQLRHSSRRIPCIGNRAVTSQLWDHCRIVRCKQTFHVAWLGSRCGLTIELAARSGEGDICNEMLCPATRNTTSEMYIFHLDISSLTCLGAKNWF